MIFNSKTNTVQIVYNQWFEISPLKLILSAMDVSLSSDNSYFQQWENVVNNYSYFHLSITAKSLMGVFFPPPIRE